MSDKISDQDLGIGYSRDIPVDSESFPRYKASVNRSEQNKIRTCHEIGYDTFQTAHYLRFQESVVKSFWPQKAGKPRNNAAA